MKMTLKYGKGVGRIVQKHKTKGNQRRELEGGRGFRKRRTKMLGKIQEDFSWQVRLLKGEAYLLHISIL